LIKSIREASKAFGNNEEELTQAEQAAITAAFAPCPVSLDNPEEIRALLDQIRSGDLVVGVSYFGNFRLVGSGSDLGGW